MLEFNKVSTESNFIKNLLATTYLPLIRTVREGDFIVADRLYIFKCNVIKCKQSGYLKGSYEALNGLPAATYKVLEEYHFGDKNGKLCTNYISNSEGYDYKTHEFLGKYLRNLRDMYGLNLMPLYNCFSNQPVYGLHIHPQRVGRDGFEYETTVYKVPIRFNTTYTICIENLGVTSFAPAFIEHNNLLKVNNSVYGNKVDVTKTYIDAHMADVITSRVGLRFKKPITIRFNNKPETKEVSYTLEENLAVSTNDSISCFKLYEESSNTPKYERTYDYETGKYHFEVASSVVSTGTYYKSVSPKDQGWLESDGTVTTDTSIDLSKTYYYPSKESVTKTVTYNITEENCRLFDVVEDKLHLLIQVPKAFESNIVILEGDYSEPCLERLIADKQLGNLTDAAMDYLFTENLKLMEVHTDTIVPASPSLMQFLLWNAICNLDTINNDMDRLYIYLTRVMETPYMFNGKYANYWTPDYRRYINQFAKGTTKKYITDNLGYVTRDIEEAIGNGDYY